MSRTNSATKWLLRAWLYLPIVGGLTTLTALMVPRNIAVSWFLAILAYAAFEGIRYLDRRFTIGIPTRTRVLQCLGGLAFCIANALWSDLTDGQPHLWSIAFATCGVFALIALPFCLFVAPEASFLPGKVREKGQ